MTSSRLETLDLLADFAHLFDLLVEQGTRTIGLTPVRARLLHAAHHLQPCRQRDLAAAAGMTTQQAALTVYALIKGGFLHRRPDPDDRRAVLIELTADGADRIADIETMRERNADTLLGHLPPAELHALTTIMESVMDRARHPRDIH